MPPVERGPREGNEPHEQPNSREQSEQKEITSQDFINAWNHIYPNQEQTQPIRQNKEIRYVQTQLQKGEFNQQQAREYVQAIATAQDKQMMLIDGLGMDNTKFAGIHNKAKEAYESSENKKEINGLIIATSLRDVIRSNDARVVNVVELAHEYVDVKVGEDIGSFEDLWAQREKLEDPHDKIKKQVSKISIDATRRFTLREIIKTGKQKEEQEEKQGTEYTDLWNKMDFQPAKTIDIVGLRKKVEGLEEHSDILELINSVEETMSQEHAAEFIASLVDEETETLLDSNLGVGDLITENTEQTPFIEHQEQNEEEEEKTEEEEQEQEIDQEKKAIFSKLETAIKNKLTGERKELAPEIISTFRNIGFDAIEIPAEINDDGEQIKPARIELFVDPTSEKLDSGLKRAITKNSHINGRQRFATELRDILKREESLPQGSREAINTTMRGKIKYPNPRTAEQILKSIWKKEGEEDKTSRAMCIQPHRSTPTHNVAFITKGGKVHQRNEAEDIVPSYTDGTEFFSTPSMSFEIEE